MARYNGASCGVCLNGKIPLAMAAGQLTLPLSGALCLIRRAGYVVLMSSSCRLCDVMSQLSALMYLPLYPEIPKQRKGHKPSVTRLSVYVVRLYVPTNSHSFSEGKDVTDKTQATMIDNSSASQRRRWKFKRLSADQCFLETLPG